MSSNKTKPTATSIPLFLNSIVPEQKQKDTGNCIPLWRELQVLMVFYGELLLLALVIIIINMRSGREGDWFLTGFSPRKNALTVFI